MIQMDLNYMIALRSGIQKEDILCVYPYGSRVYGNFNINSDCDYIVIVKNKTNEQFSDNLININYYTNEEHQNRLDNHEISALECFFLEKNLVYETCKFSFKLDLSKLRNSLSANSSNSWVKCKKKLTVEQDYDLSIGRKSMFHAFRIINFGIQIATTGRIINYSSCNTLYYEIFAHNEWQDLFDTFKERYNKICTEFRIVAPK